MSVPKLNYSKEWTNPQDFPAVASDETQARKNIQLLFDEIRDFVNKYINPAVDAAALGLITDSVTGKKYAIGIEDGKPYIEEVP